MLFNSYIFLFAFLPAVLVWWYRVPMGLRARLVGLTVASYAFYGYWDYRFTSLMLASTFVDYVAGARIHAAADEPTRRRWLIVSVGLNLGLLAVFKYMGFAGRSVNAVLGLLGHAGRVPVLDVVLPVGISFYTFQSMSYTIDIYRRQARPTEGFWHFAAYVSLFPQLVAGPIVRYTHLEEQLREIAPVAEPRRLRLGVQLLVVGLLKKLVIADSMGRWADTLLAAPATLDQLGAWFAILAYAFQIYFDFSGYSDMAVGLGRLLGFEFPQNFDSPYKATDIADFWRRWHMTLSTWLRDYLYIPLGGSRGGALRTARNLVVTMFLGGLWHGAAWTFVVWGLYHGTLLALCHGWQRTSSVRLPEWPARLVTFVAVLVGWVFFRAASLGDAVTLLQAMAGMQGTGWFHWGYLRPLAGDCAVALGICWFLPNSWEIEFGSDRRWAAAFALGAALAVALLRRPSPFLYFQF